MINFGKTWTYDDVLLEPAYTSIISHKHVSLKTKLVGDLWVDSPIIMAPMSAIHDLDLYIEMIKLGTLPWLHRYITPDEQTTCAMHLVDAGTKIIAIAVSTKENDYKNRIELCGEYINGKPLVVKIDVANGASWRSIQTIENIKKTYPWVYVFSGNICTKESALMCINAGADGLMVGVGPGFSCSTRLQTGIGKGAAHSVFEIASYVKNNHPGITICADGGFRKAGDFVKAFALGADLCMSGYLFRRGTEYYGMASNKALCSIGKNNRASEGECIISDINRDTSKIKKDITDTLDRIKSAFSYLGCNNIDDLHDAPINIYMTTRAVSLESNVGYSVYQTNTCTER